MEEYKGNAHRQRNVPEKPQKVVKPVVESARLTKKRGGSKFMSAFFAEDISEIKGYLLEDVVVPAIKNLIADTVIDGIKAVLGMDRTGARKGASSKVSYSSYSDRDYSTRRDHGVYDFGDITVDSRGEAEEILSSLIDIIDTYGQASVADLYDLAGVTGEYTATEYGWTNLSSASVVRTRDGYSLKLPRARALGK